METYNTYYEAPAEDPTSRAARVALQEKVWSLAIESWMADARPAQNNTAPTEERV